MTNQLLTKPRLPFFPEPYPGEILYSMFARYAFQLLHVNAKSANEDLFGSRIERLGVDMPHRLELLAARLPVRLKLTAERLLLKHTLFPYYAAYSDARIVHAARAAAFGTDGKVASILGTDARPIGRAMTLRFCRECVAAADEAGRDPHWLRVHQIPITAFCTLHDAPLQISTVDLSKISPRLEMPTRENCPDDAPTVMHQDGDVDALLGLSRNAAGLLEGIYPTNAPPGVRATLSNAFAAKGIAMNGSAIQWPMLEAAVEPVVAGVAAVFPDVARVGRNESGWLRRTIHLGRQTHTDTILLSTFALSRLPEPRKPFGDGPWPCRNPLAAHYGQNVVTGMRLKLYGSGAVRGWFNCDCGYGYIVLRASDGTMGRFSFNHFGPLIEPFVRDRSAEGWSIKRTARAAGVDPATLVRLVRERAMKHSWDPGIIAKSNHRPPSRSKRSAG